GPFQVLRLIPEVYEPVEIKRSLGGKLPHAVAVRERDYVLRAFAPRQKDNHRTQCNNREFGSASFRPPWVCT
ncbi:unnamed protein product, partial [Ectocarpus sp. 13 AM-2016]